jgi:hypothetical protein
MKLRKKPMLLSFALTTVCGSFDVCFARGSGLCRHGHPLLLLSLIVFIVSNSLGWLCCPSNSENYVWLQTPVSSLWQGTCGATRQKTETNIKKNDRQS